MMNLSRWKVIAVVLSAIFGVLFTLPNLLPADVRDSLPGFMPKQTLNLGLDLQGGSHLLLEVDTAALKRERLTNLVEDTRTTLREAQIPFAELREVNGPGIETLGGIEFQNSIGTQHVDGTHFRDHVLRDLAHDLVQALLRLERLRHQFAQPLEKNARTRGEVSHRVASPENDVTPPARRRAGDHRIGADSASPYFLSRP